MSGISNPGLFTSTSYTTADISHTFKSRTPKETTDAIAAVLSKVWSDKPTSRLNLFLKISTIRIFAFVVGVG